MRGVVVDGLMRDLRLSVCRRVDPCIRIPVPQRKPTAREMHADVVAFMEHAGGGQKFQCVVVYLTGRIV